MFRLLKWSRSDMNNDTEYNANMAIIDANRPKAPGSENSEFADLLIFLSSAHACLSNLPGAIDKATTADITLSAQSHGAGCAQWKPVLPESAS